MTLGFLNELGGDRFHYVIAWIIKTDKKETTHLLNQTVMLYIPLQQPRERPEIV